MHRTPAAVRKSRLTTRETSASGEPAVGRVNDCKYDVISSPALTWAHGLPGPAASYSETPSLGPANFRPT